MIYPGNFMIDTVGNIYISGQNYGTLDYLLYKISSNGSSIIWTASTSLVLGKDIRQQAGGRIVCTGDDVTGGVIIGFDPNDGTIDPYFGGNGSAAGYYQTGFTSKTADIAVINSYKDDIIFACRDNSGNAVVTCLIQNGYQTEPDFTFGTPIPNVSDGTQIHMSLDVNQKIVVVARNTTGNFIAQRYNTNGTNDVGPVTITLTNPTTTVLQNTVSLSDGSTLILGSNTNGNTIIAARLNPSFALDTTFNQTGILQETDLPMTQFNDICISSLSAGGINNNIVVAGSSLAPVPYLTNIYNNVSVTETIQSAPALVVVGTLDETLAPDGANPGYINLESQLGTTQLAYSQAKQIVVQLSNGIYYVGADNGTNTQIMSFDGHDNVQISTFGTAGVITILGKAQLASLFLDATGELNVTGGSGASGSNAGWIKRYNATNGTLNTTFAPTDVMDVNLDVIQQQSTRILVSGQEDGFGTIVGYNSVTGAIDTSFGPNVAANGRWVTPYTSSINSLAVNPDSVGGSIYYIVNDNSNNATTFSLKVDGGALNWTSDSTIAHSTISTNTHLVLDS